MAQRKFLDDNGVRLLLQKLDQYPNNELLGTVVEAIGEELDKRPGVITYDLTCERTVEVQDGGLNVSSITYNNFNSSYGDITIYAWQFSFITDKTVDLSELIKTNHIQFQVDNRTYGRHVSYTNGQVDFFSDDKKIVIGQLISATNDSAVIMITRPEPNDKMATGRHFNTLFNDNEINGPFFYMFHARPDPENPSQNFAWISDTIPLNPPALLFTDVPNIRTSYKTENTVRTLCTLRYIIPSTYWQYSSGWSMEEGWSYGMFRTENIDYQLDNAPYTPDPYAPVTQEMMKYFLKKNLLNIYGLEQYKPPILYVGQITTPDQIATFGFGNVAQICTYNGCFFLTPDANYAEHNTTTNNINNSQNNTMSLKAIKIEQITKVTIKAISFSAPGNIQYTYVYDETLNLFQRVKDNPYTGIEIY